MRDHSFVPDAIEEKIMTRVGWVTRTQLEQMHKESGTSPPPVDIPPSKQCPYKSGVNRACDGEKCSWYVLDKCAQTCPNPSAGRRCPIRGDKCILDCGLRGE